MNGDIVSQIESAFKENKANDAELAAKLGIDTNDLGFFLNQFNLFSSFCVETLPSAFANVFHSKNLFDLELKAPHKEESFIKAIVVFINEKMNSKVKYQLKVETEKEISRNISVLKQLNKAKEFKYEIEGNDELPFEKYPELFTYVKKYKNEDFFQQTFNKIINQSIKVDCIYYLDLDKVESLDKVIEYSTKYPNVIKKLYLFDYSEDEKIKKIAELNSESLIRAANQRIDLFTSCKNIEYLEFNSQDIPENAFTCGFSFDKVKSIGTVKLMDLEDEEEANKLLTLFNKCPNLETIKFSTFTSLSSEFFFSFFPKITSNKVRRIYAEIFDFEESENYDPIFEHFPKLEKLCLEEHNSMSFVYSVKPIFTCEGNHLSLPNLEKLITNYLNSKPYHYIKLNFQEEYSEFMNYFKEKTNIMSKVLSITSQSEEVNENYVKFQSVIELKNEDSLTKKLGEKAEEVHIKGEALTVDQVKEPINKYKADIVMTYHSNINEKNLLTNCPEVKVVLNCASKKITLKNKEQANNLIEYELA